MTKDQPKPIPLYLADKLEDDPSTWGGVAQVAWPAATQLRRLHDLLGKANALARIRAKTIDKLEAENEELKSDCIEQSRIIGMGAERELALMAESEALREALNALVGTQDDPQNGWRGTGGTDVLFACEYCGKTHPDCTQIVHLDDCPVPTARAALARAGETK